MAKQSEPTWETLVNPTERQRDFIKAFFEYDFTLYGGAAGGGKSYILRWIAVLYLRWLYTSKKIKNAHVAIFCEDYPSLYDRQISKIMFEFPPELGRLRHIEGTVNFEMRPELGGGIIALRNLDDPSKYLSAEWAAILVDELTRNEMVTFDFLRMRCRWPGVARPKFAAATNPGERGHAWVKKLWIDRDFTGFSPEFQKMREQFAFVPAKAMDNPHLDPGYYERLKSLPPDMAKAYAEGSWDMFAGQYFDLWSAPRHTIRAEQIPIESWWPRWMSIDWGFKHDSAVYWHTTAPDGKHFTYRELVQNGLTPRMLGQAIAELSFDSDRKREKIQRVYLSPDAFAQRTSESTIALQLDEILVPSLGNHCIEADNDRVGGWMLMYGLLERQQWFVSTACPRLIGNIPTLVRDAPKKPEDCIKRDGDDPADSARYGIYSHLRPEKEPFNVTLTKRLDAVPDYTAKHMLHLQMEDQDKQAREKVAQFWRRGRGMRNHAWTR